MYSSKSNVLQLGGLLKAHGIHQVVLSPGSRNSPIAQSLAGDAFFTCHSVVDERSAGFYALGLIQQTSEAAAICCTSGTAALNYAPAVAEAFYQGLPLVVITADRPAAWIGQMAGQTLPQAGMFRSLVKKAVQLPEIASAEDEWYCNRLINEALLATHHHGRGPVHINIPLSEPLSGHTCGPIPEVRRIRRANSIDTYSRRLAASFERPLIIVGQLHRCDFYLPLNDLQLRYNCVVLAEHLSNIPPPYFIRNFDALLGSLAEGE
ncbi:MAG: 2-succinyl-5-enolpyruvyl-6-hydroxy-3-cyclohexene-1-carboxylic-acid synthase, partial [Clostridiales bacterium]|nr:2-succinyl-5-enolpyruvyl-6-hydroxy-3-cyclohexene-1-carboxylic-acid synthase [Clostridiales bacterium]